MDFSAKKEKLHMFLGVFKNLDWALTILKEFRIRLIVYIVLLMAQSVYAIFLASQVGNIVDLALLDDMETLIKSGSFLIMLYLINMAITIVCNRMASRNFNSIYNALQLKVYRKIMNSSWEELTEYHSGDLITRLASDIKIVAGNTSGLVPTMIAQITLVIGAGIYTIALDYSMVVVIIFVAPIILLSSRIFMGKIYNAHMNNKMMESRINSFNKETFNNIQAVKAFDLGDSFYYRMEELELKRKEFDLQTSKYALWSWGISFFSGLLGMSICIGWMFYRVHSGVISFGALSVLAYLTFQCGQAMKSFLSLFPDIMEYMACAERVKKLLALEDENNLAEAKEIEAFEKIAAKEGVTVNIQNMSFKYRNGYSVFEDVSLEAKPGEIVALVGPSGEGKTTMLRIILGIVTALSGKVYASTFSGKNLDLGKQTRSIISYVPQGNTMMAGSIIDNMRLVSKDASEEKIEEALKTACIYDFVNKLPDGLEHNLGENGLGFSEGQNQRLSIARALLKDSPILLMDEATSALDVATERQILSNIMKKNPKKAVIITTHRPTVLSMCDRVYRIANKKVSIAGPEDIQKLIDEF